uniref:hypothetical protein n=1 Tax=Thaumasiovibrio occultus TaxID=1891184 RepID=UPI000B34C7B1|nr:hypothetical protein [Thaumasiovibrio occultus]
MKVTVTALYCVVASLGLSFAAHAKDPSLLEELEVRLQQNGEFYLSSQSSRRHNFDVWQLNSGYAYAVAPNLELYLSTSITSGNDQVSTIRGVASGVKYDVSPRLHIESAVTSRATTDQNTETNEVGFEVSSRYHLTEKVNVHATYDYEDVEQQYTVGIGYRF